MLELRFLDEIGNANEVYCDKLSTSGAGLKEGGQPTALRNSSHFVVTVEAAASGKENVVRWYVNGGLDAAALAKAFHHVILAPKRRRHRLLGEHVAVAVRAPVDRAADLEHPTPALWRRLEFALGVEALREEDTGQVLQDSQHRGWGSGMSSSKYFQIESSASFLC